MLMKKEADQRDLSTPQATAASNRQPKSPFIELIRDYGFKIVMADDDHPGLMLRFLNEIIPERTIVSIKFLNTEVLPPEEGGKRQRYDILCTDKDGNRFLVEMQKDPYQYFQDRLMVYTGDPLTHLLKSGEFYDRTRTLYVICILGGYLKIDGETREEREQLVRRAYVTMQSSQKILTDKLNFVFLQLPAAEEPAAESTFIERWAYYVREMGNVSQKPDGLDGYFSQLFDAANRRNIEERKLTIYDNMVRDEIQIQAEKQYALDELREELELQRQKDVEEAKEQGIEQGIEKGIEQGIEQGKLDTARKFKAAGIAAQVISQCTGLTPEQIASL